MDIPSYIGSWFYLLIIVIVTFNLYLILKIKSSTKVRLLLVFSTLIWPIVPGYLAFNGFLMDTQSVPPNIGLVILGNIIQIFLMAFWVKEIKDVDIPLPWLIGIQSFRIPLEVWLAQLFLEGLNSKMMTYHGYNFDIITGISALLIVLLIVYGGSNQASLVRAWNYMGLGFIVVVVSVAFMNIDTPFRVFDENPPTRIILYFPYVWLPSILVLSAVYYHLICLRILRIKATSNKNN